MILSLIVAMSENGVIGKDQKLPWHLSEDLKRFKRLTLGHPVIMGRKTYESMGRLLPERTNIIVTHNVNRSVEGAVMAKSIEEALRPYRATAEEVFVIGGGEIYNQTLGICDKIYLTLVHQHIEGDVFFPYLDPTLFEETSRERIEKPLSFSFIDLVHSNKDRKSQP